MTTYLLQVAICWGLFLGLYHLTLRKETFFVVNRAYLLLTIILGLLIPRITWDTSMFMEEPTVEVAVEYLSQGFYELNAMVSPTSDLTEPSENTAPRIGIIGIIYLTGVVLMLFKLLMGIAKIALMYRSATKEIKDGQTIAHTNKDHAPFTFLGTIYLGLPSTPLSHQGNPNQEKSKAIPLSRQEHSIHEEQLQAEQIISPPERSRREEIILIHESAHVSGWHTLDVIFIELVKAFFWFNPLVYGYDHALKTVHEYIADANVLQRTALQRYGRLLLRQAQPGLEIALANHFYNQQLKTRFKMMTRTPSQKRMLFKYLSVLPFILMVSLVFTNQKVQAEISKVEEIDLEGMFEKGSDGKISDTDKNYIKQLLDQMFLVKKESLWANYIPFDDDFRKYFKQSKISDKKQIVEIINNYGKSSNRDICATISPDGHIGLGYKRKLSTSYIYPEMYEKITIWPRNNGAALIQFGKGGMLTSINDKECIEKLLINNKSEPLINFGIIDRDKSRVTSTSNDPEQLKTKKWPRPVQTPFYLKPFQLSDINQISILKDRSLLQHEKDYQIDPISGFVNLKDEDLNFKGNYYIINTDLVTAFIQSNQIERDQRQLKSIQNLFTNLQKHKEDKTVSLTPWEELQYAKLTELTENKIHNFKIEIRRENNQLLYECIEGCIWESLGGSYSGTNALINTSGISVSTDHTRSNKVDTTGFAFKVILNNDQLQLEGIIGMYWKILNFTLPKGKKQKIDQNGMVRSEEKADENSIIPSTFDPSKGPLKLLREGSYGLEIFNRWGNVVYESDSYNNDWNGTWNSGLLKTQSLLAMLKQNGEVVESAGLEYINNTKTDSFQTFEDVLSNPPKLNLKSGEIRDASGNSIVVEQYNPKEDILNFYHTAEYELKIYQSNGHLLFEDKNYRNNWDGKIDNKLLSTQLLFLLVSIDGRTKRGKWIVYINEHDVNFRPRNKTTGTILPSTFDPSKGHLKLLEEGEYGLEIYNRWGNVVYKNDNYQNDWDGTWQDNKELPAASYFATLTKDRKIVESVWFKLKRIVKKDHPTRPVFPLVLDHQGNFLFPIQLQFFGFEIKPTKNAIPNDQLPFAYTGTSLKFTNETEAKDYVNSLSQVGLVNYTESGDNVSNNELLKNVVLVPSAYKIPKIFRNLKKLNAQPEGTFNRGISYKNGKKKFHVNHNLVNSHQLFVHSLDGKELVKTKLKKKKGAPYLTDLFSVPVDSWPKGIIVLTLVSKGNYYQTALLND